MATKSSSLKKFIVALVVIIVIALGFTCFFYYMRYYGPNVTDKEQYLYIHTGATFDDVYKTIRDKGIVKDTATFHWAANNMDYASRVKAGRYRLHDGMSNRKLINMLASGEQEPVTLSFNNLRLEKQFAGYVSKKIEPDSASIMHLLDSTSFLQQYNLTKDDAYVVFLPNTYQLYWNTTPEKFFKKMYASYERFWTAERKQKAAALNLTQAQVSILASIVDAEALHDDEMPTIAGLYLNRLRKGMKLESDPTVIFAKQDFTIHRVLNRDLAVESPYNTYQHTGLPPGPIMMPSINAINAVLDYIPSNYLYMCAKADFSGYHAFASTVAEHLANARKYQQALTSRHIER
jgi:UPF0755 protein